jgi:hypothetical protein
MDQNTLITRSLAGYSYVFVLNATNQPEKNQVFLFLKENVLYAKIIGKDPFIVQYNLYISENNKNEVDKVFNLIKTPEGVTLLSDSNKRDLGIYTSLSKHLNRGHHSIKYDEQWRDFFIHLHDVSLEKDDDWLSAIFYCPFCGTKLPESLADKWFEVLENEYVITDPSETEYDKVPSEFRTDEWWKKRGL